MFREIAIISPLSQHYSQLLITIDNGFPLTIHHYYTMINDSHTIIISLSITINHY